MLQTSVAYIIWAAKNNSCVNLNQNSCANTYAQEKAKIKSLRRSNTESKKMGWERMPVSKNVVLHLIFMLAALFQAFLHKTVKVLVQTKNNNNKSAEKHKLNQQSSSRS